VFLAEDVWVFIYCAGYKNVEEKITHIYCNAKCKMDSFRFH
jgi:hypothetical protein